VNLHYIPVYRQPYFEVMGFPQGYCPEAERYFKETITLPMFPTLTMQQQSHVIQTLSEILRS
jgi:dTDP-4-amino-4,6-dideoxygalactose transaminase